jgi:hypothetical protein
MTQYHILRWLYTTDSIEESIVRQWVTLVGQKYQHQTLRILREWHLLHESVNTKRLNLHPTFKLHLGYALNGGGPNHSFGILLEQETIDKSLLEQHASQRWRGILHFMVGTREDQYAPEERVISLLRDASLMA